MVGVKIEKLPEIMLKFLKEIVKVKNEWK